LLEDGGIDRILLSTKSGKTGYRIVKLNLLPGNLNASGEACVKIFSDEQSTATFAFDFSDTTLMAGAYYTANVSMDANTLNQAVVFDRIIVNQDIYITHKNNDNVPWNYYLELEVIKLDDHEAMVTTIQNIRNNQ